MRILESKTPAVFWDDEPATVNLEFPRGSLDRVKGMKGLSVKYRIEDAFEREVATGEVPVDFTGDADPFAMKLELPVPEFGWYRGFFTVTDAEGSLIEGSERLFFQPIHLPIVLYVFYVIFCGKPHLPLGAGASLLAHLPSPFSRVSSGRRELFSIFFGNAPEFRAWGSFN